MPISSQSNGPVGDAAGYRLPAGLSESIDLDGFRGLSAKTQAYSTRVRQLSIAPDAMKGLRRFSLAEASEMTGIPKATLQRHAVGSYEHGRLSLETIHQVQAKLGKSPRRPEGVAPFVLSSLFLKGGVGKTTTAFHIAQYFSRRGYRVIAADLDPQGSLTYLYGLIPDAEVMADDTAEPFLVGDADGDDLRANIRPTNWPGMRLLPGASALHSVDVGIARGMREIPGFHPWLRGKALVQELAASDVDIIVIDTPPALSWTTLNVLWACDGIVSPMDPTLLSVASATEFSNLIVESIDAFERASEEKKIWDLFMVVLNNVDAGDPDHEVFAGHIRSMFAPHVAPVNIPHARVVSKVQARLWSVYEATPKDFDGRSLRRLRDAYDQLGRKLEGMIQATWMKRIQAAEVAGDET
jgi:chromosome partitioning protein